MFESWAISEVLKAHDHRGVTPEVSFFQDRRGREVDLVVEQGAQIVAAEVKSASTLTGAFFDALESFRTTLAEADGPEVASV